MPLFEGEIIDFKSLKSLQNVMDTAKTIDLICLCIQINNTVVFFQSYTQAYKECQAKTNVKQKYTSLWIKHHDFRLWTFIIELSDSINNEALK